MQDLLKLLCFFSIFTILPTPISPISPPSPTNIVLYNDASFDTTNNSISLTQQNCTPNTNSSIGRAFYANPVRFLDPSTNATLSFSCNFTFVIKSTRFCPFGNGMAFIITSNVEPFSLRDGYLGLPEEIGTSVSEIPVSYFAVEFDTSFDKGLDVLESEHVGVNVNGVRSLASVDILSRFGISLKDGKQISVWIEYDGSVKIVSVWVGYLKNIRPKKPVIALRIDLSRQFKEFMHVGFTAGNGRGSSIHRIDSWRFRPLDEVSRPGLPVKESECLICEKDATDSVITDAGFFEDHSSDKRFLRFALALGGSGLAVVLIVVSITFCLCVMRRRRIRQARSERHLRRFQGRGMVPKMWSLNDIKWATNGFNDSKVIGEGASAVVYQGDIPSCGQVAIKRFINDDDSFISSRIPFTTEFKTMVGCLSHKNLVQLRGWCCEKGELVLVYEHLANGSLDKILHTYSSLSKFLTWEKRVNIIQGVASAIIYLHEECESQIIHRDIKTCNILLDSEFNAKLGDFGLAEVYRHSFRTRDATVPAGTMGYLAPEYVFTGVPSAETDVFSFGVVILEVATGRRPVDEARVTICDYVWGLWEKGKLMEAADPRLHGKFDKTEMERMLIVGLMCAHFNCDMRPKMKEVARMLRGEATLPVLPSKKPTVRIQSVLSETCDEIMSLGTADSPWGTPKTHFSKN